MRIERPLACNNCFLCPCSKQGMTIEAPPGVEIGSVRQKLSMFGPKLEIRNLQGDAVYIVNGTI